MGETAVIPAWVVQPPAQVADCHRIAHAVATQTGDVPVSAVAATINWVTGGQESPLTERPGEPTRDVARAEMLAAGGPVPADAWRSLGVEPRQPVTVHAGWCSAVAATLGWLLGVHTRSPIRLPRRNADGTTPTGEQLYREAVEARPYCAWTPEQRASARDEAYAEAARHRRLVELADSVTSST